MRLKKKGVSPLIATVLLIAFAVALGAVVMNWGRTYVEETADKAKQTSDTKVSCSMDVGMKYVTINGAKQLCYNTTDDRVQFTLINSGTKKIESIQVMIIGESSIFINSSLSNSSIEPSHPLKTNVTYVFDTFGDIQKVSITPAIKVEGKIDPILCADNSLDVDELSACS